METPNSPAALFANAAGTGKPNPFTADAQGRFSFWALSGSYNITIMAPGFSSVLVGVPVSDRRVSHTIGGSNTQGPLTLVEASGVTTGGNAALALERRRADGSRVYGPWSLHVDKGPAGRQGDLRWLNNVDWNESAQATSGFLTADAGFAMTLAPRGPITAPGAAQRFSFAFQYAPAGPVGGAPAWSTLFRHDEAQFSSIGTLPITRVGGGPLVVGDGLPNSSLIARRVGWDTFQTTAPAGVLLPLAGVATPPAPGEVAVSVPDANGYPIPARTTLAAQRDATVFLRGGNGSPATLLGVGKALVRTASGAVAAPGDVVVSSGIEAGRAIVDNTITDPRKIVGFALEEVGATLPGYLAIVRTSR